MFSHLHVHTHYSFLEAIGKVGALVEKAQQYGMNTLALTDYSGLYGVVEFYDYAKKANIKPILGVEMFFSFQTLAEGLKHQLGTLVFLAKNYDGYQELLKRVSQANTHLVGGVPVLTQAMITPSQNVICITGYEKSILGQAIINGSSVDKQQDMITKLQHYFPTTLLELTVQEYTLVPHARTLNDSLNSLAEQMNLRCTLSNNVHYVNTDDKQAFEIALCIKDNTKRYEKDRRTIKGDYSFFSEEKIHALAITNGMTEEFYAQCIETHQRVSDQIDLKIPMGMTYFPKYQSEENISTLYQKVENDLVLHV